MNVITADDTNGVQLAFQNGLVLRPGVFIFNNDDVAIPSLSVNHSVQIAGDVYGGTIGIMIGDISTGFDTFSIRNTFVTIAETGSVSGLDQQFGAISFVGSRNVLLNHGDLHGHLYGVNIAADAGSTVSRVSTPG